MRRVLNLWLALLGAYWLTRAGVTAAVPWGGAAATLGSLSATALLVGAALAAAAGNRAVAAGVPRRRRVPGSEPGEEPA